jgi:chromosomal replication initiator protein
MKAEQNGLSIPEDVAYYLANSVSSNIRELEGYLVRIVAYANLMSVPVTEATAREVLKHILVEKSRDISVEEIQKTVATYFNIKVSELRSAKRVKNLVLPRQIAMYLSRQLTSYSFPDIGDRFGGKDHSTIIYAIKKMEKQMEEDVQLKTSIENIRAMLIR